MIAAVAVGLATIGVLGTAGVAQAADATASGPATRAQQWYLNQFDMNTVWNTSRGKGVTVAIVGSGVDEKQSDISGASAPQIDFSSGSPKPAAGDVSSSNDGTAAAVLIAGSGLDSSGIEGLAPKAKLLPLRYYADDKATPTPAYAALAIRYAADHGARVILMPSPAPYNTASLTDAVGYALDKGAVVITSASNNGRTSNQMTAPCTVRGAVCVSGTTQDGTVWQDSSTGSAVTLGAPAENLPVWAQDKYGIHSSTHYSAALVAGEAALVLSAHPTWTAGQVISAMIDTATGGNAAHSRVNNKVGYGVMNPGAAVKAPQPSSTGNPLGSGGGVTPTGGAGASAPATTGGSAGAGGSSSGSQSSSSLPWVLIGIGAAVVVLGAVLVVLMLRRRGGHRNYLSDPAYQAGQYFGDGETPYGADGGQYTAEPQPYAPDNFSRPQPQQPQSGAETAPPLGFPYQYDPTPPPPPVVEPTNPPVTPQSDYSIPESWLQSPQEWDNQAAPQQAAEPDGGPGVPPDPEAAPQQPGNEG